MELRTYLVILVRGWIVLAACLLAGLLVAGAVVFFQTPQYAATAQVVFTAQRAGSGQDLAYAGNYVQGRMQTYKNLAASPKVLDPVTDELDLSIGSDELAERVDVEVSQIDTLIRITVEDGDAGDSAVLANAVAAQLIAAVDDLENGATVDEEAPLIAGEVVGPAQEPGSPAQPRLWFTLLVGLTGGLLIGAAALTLRHVLRSGSTR